MEKLTFTKANLSNVRVIMVIMHVPLEELLYQAVVGWIPVLECLLSAAHGPYGYVLSCWRPAGCDCQGPRYVLSRVTRRIYNG
jgi:hypothetical protein